MDFPISSEDAVTSSIKICASFPFSSSGKPLPMEIRHPYVLSSYPRNFFRGFGVFTFSRMAVQGDA